MPYQRQDGQSDKFTILNNSNGFRIDITGAPTANRTLTAPDRTGTCATVDQIDSRVLEKITISSTISTATAIYTTAYTPKDSTSIEMIVNGEVIPIATSPALFSISGSTITWLPANSYILETSDNVFVRYAVAVS